MSNKLRFNDGVEFDLSGKYRLERRKDGYYVVGQGFMIPVSSKAHGEEVVKDLKNPIEED